MAQRIYIQREDIVDGNTTLIAANSYVNRKNLNITQLTEEATSTGQSLQVIAQKHIVNLEYTQPSEKTLIMRNQFASSIDDFASFYWCGIDMFAEFGVFIVNEKKVSLKFYNGPSYTNNYSKQQFQEGYTNLTGVTFDTQKITFTVGVYWISIEDYRVLMNLLHPYEVNMLSFSFEKTYGYQCKLSAIKDSTRYILGKESFSQGDDSHLRYSRIEGNNGDGYRYYTELVLTFEVIGKQCAKEITPYQYSNNITPAVSENSIVWNTINGTTYEVQTYWPSDLDFPFELLLNNLVFKVNSYSNTYHLKLEAVVQVDNQTAQKTTLFEIILKNLIPKENPENTQEISLRYDSEQGLLYWALEDKQQILSLLSTNNDGQRIISYLDIKRFFWSGRLDNPEVAESNYKYWLELSNICDYDSVEDEICGNIISGNTTYKASRRTNVL